MTENKEKPKVKSLLLKSFTLTFEGKDGAIFSRTMNLDKLIFEGQEVIVSYVLDEMDNPLELKGVSYKGIKTSEKVN